jgi:hypothetical protein
LPVQQPTKFELVINLAICGFGRRTERHHRNKRSLRQRASASTKVSPM